MNEISDRMAARGFPRHGGNPSPPAPIDREVAPHTAHPPERMVARAPMPHHGEPSDVAALLARVSARMIDDGYRPEALVTVLAARGYSTSTMGDGGPRSTDSTTPVERAAGVAGDPKKPTKDPLARWRGKDREFHQTVADLERLALRYESLHTDVMAHAGDDDPVPVGTGHCVCCAKLVRPTADKDWLRLKAGLCPACYKSWQRYQAEGGQLVRSDWLHERRKTLTDDRGELHPDADEWGQSEPAA